MTTEGLRLNNIARDIIHEARQNEEWARLNRSLEWESPIECEKALSRMTEIFMGELNRLTDTYPFKDRDDITVAINEKIGAMTGGW